ncbi:hypothetical protein Taro_030725 [Colocasia esculenta]|uniref:Uncharacterized protein n=1 Tax=Colocasia esculenta TaxID=4460 RepID=A0A843VM40_COLES|nr:hypothetical protein [Colocasia esculenta]
MFLTRGNRQGTWYRNGCLIRLAHLSPHPAAQAQLNPIPASLERRGRQDRSSRRCTWATLSPSGRPAVVGLTCCRPWTSWARATAAAAVAEDTSSLRLLLRHRPLSPYLAVILLTIDLPCRPAPAWCLTRAAVLRHCPSLLRPFTLDLAVPCTVQGAIFLRRY